MAEESTETRQTPAAKSGLNKKQRGGIVLLLIIVVGAILGLQRWVHSKTHIETDNAFVESHVHSVSSRIPSPVLRVAVVDNQYVQKGDLLVELDPADYEASAKSAAASLEMARNETSGDYAEVEEARASIGLATAGLEQANLDLRRGEALYAKEVIPREQLDRLRTALRIAQMRLREAQEAENRAKAMIGVSGTGSRDARVAQKQGELDTARLNLSYARIVAPNDGYVTRRGVEAGNYVQPGQALMAVVSLKDAWITANYKESQLTDVRPGQKVEFTVDSYPGAGERHRELREGDPARSGEDRHRQGERPRAPAARRHERGPRDPDRQAVHGCHRHRQVITRQIKVKVNIEIEIKKTFWNFAYSQPQLQL